MPSRIGATFEQQFPVLGMHVPLRPGPWTVLTDSRRPSASTLTVDCFLGSLKDAHLHEAIRILAVIDAAETRESYGPIVFGDNTLYQVVDADGAGGRHSVWSIHNMITWPWAEFHDRTTGIVAGELAAAEAMHKRQITFPPELLVARFVCREQGKALQADYYLSPDFSPVPARELRTWRDGNYAPLRIRNHPAEFAFYRDTIAWGAQWWPLVMARFAEFHPQELF